MTSKLIFLSMLSVAGFAQDKPAESPTLEQTREWLSNNLGALSVAGSFKIGDESITESIRWIPVELKSCSLAVRRFEQQSSSSAQPDGTRRFEHQSCSRVFTVPLGSIVSLTAGRRALQDFWGRQPEGISIALYTLELRSKSANIQSEGTCTSNGNSSSSNKRLQVVEFETGDSDFLRRIQNALTHAADLCKAKEIF